MIRRARTDEREARGNEEREKREDEKGSHCLCIYKQYIYTSCVVSCLSRLTGGDSFYEYWMFFWSQPVEIKIQTGEVNLERSPAL